MAGVIFAALPSVGEREDHVTVDLLDSVFPRLLVRFRQLLLNLLCAVIMAVVCWRVWILAERALQYGDRTEFLRIPVAPVVYFIAIMCGVAALILALNAVYYALGRREAHAGSGL